MLKSKGRNTLQNLQPSVNEKVMRRGAMKHAEENDSKEKSFRETLEVNSSVAKENIPTLRRSKRKNVQLKMESNTVSSGKQFHKNSKAKSSATKTSKCSSSVESKLEKPITEEPETDAFSTENFYFEERKELIEDNHHFCERLILDNEKFSWKELAEERRLMLEKALHENEMLHNQLTALETENFQLKQLATEAEDLASIMKGIIQ